MADWLARNLAFPLSVLALSVAGYQAYEAHQQRTSQFQPLINFYWDTEQTSTQVGMAIENKGPGPAIIKQITFYVDGKSTDIDDALRSAGLDPKNDRGEDLEENDAIATGERVWLIDYHAKNPEESAKITEFLDGTLAVKVLYCSIADKCPPPKCSEKGRCGSEAR